MKHILDECLDAIVKTFKNTNNKYEAHLKCYPILNRMASNDEVILEVMKRNMAKPTFFGTKRCTPDFQLTLLDETECFMFVNFFGPNKEKRTDYSYSTMHHHDDFLLSTINAKGTGYTSMIFKQGYNIDKNKMEARVDLDRYVPHSPSKIEFIDCHTAHTIFYPESTTMTYGLWSTFYPTSAATKFKKHPLVQKNKQLIKNVLDKLSLNVRNIGVAQYREDYFYPENGKLKFLSGQVLPKNGEHFAQNFFNVVQEFLNFPDTKFLKELYTKLKASDNSQVVPFVEKIIENERVERNYDSYNMYAEYRNVPIEEYRKVYDF